MEFAVAKCCAFAVTECCTFAGEVLSESIVGGISEMICEFFFEV